MRLEVLLLGAIAPTAKSICTSETRIFHVKVDLFASEVGKEEWCRPVARVALPWSMLSLIPATRIRGLDDGSP